jgi:hypothetical protein
MGRVGIALSTVGILTAAGLLDSAPPSAALAAGSQPVTVAGLYDSLTSVDATGPDDAWAVGFSRSENATTALAMHWDGTTWTKVETPHVPQSSRFYSVAFVSPTDGWAVGVSDEQYHSDSIYHGHTLVEHWDGTHWKRVNSVDPNPFFRNVLTSVTAISSNDVWAAGYRFYDDEEGPVSLTEHWDGTRWSWVKSDIPGEFRHLFAVAGTSSSDVWAVGRSEQHAFAQHWDGSTFVGFEPPAHRLRAITAISPTDVWAVGGTTAVHWDGEGWTLAEPPSIGALRAVAATGPSDVWAASRHRFARWDGTTWTRVRSPRVDLVRGIDVESPTDAWAVGQDDHASLIEHWDGTAWTVVD